MFYDNLKDKPVKVQCTWANAYKTTNVDRNFCLRSYDRKMLYDNYYNIYKYSNAANRQKVFIDKPINEFVLGWLTGNSVVVGDVEWMEVQLLYTNRNLEKEITVYNIHDLEVIGWMRLNDITFDGKNPGNINPDPDPDPDPVVTEKKSWLKWILGGLTVLQFLK